MEVKETFLHAGGKQFNYISCLNDSEQWIRGLSEIVNDHILGWPQSGTKNANERALSKQNALAIGAKD